MQQRANKQTITINKKGQRPSIFANRSIFFKTKSREPIKLRVGQNAMLWLAVGISDRCLHKNANLQTGLRVSMITPIFLKSADLELPISRPPQDFFCFFKKIQLIQNIVWFWSPFQPTQLVRILCIFLGRAIDTLGMSGYVTPEIFRIQSFLAVSHVDVYKIWNVLTKSTCIPNI